jgi:hypothetical protein
MVWRFLKNLFFDGRAKCNMSKKRFQGFWPDSFQVEGKKHPTSSFALAGALSF